LNGGVAKKLGLQQPSPKEPLYSKKRNAEIALHLKLDDLSGTDLLGVVNDVGKMAKRMMNE
jgi:hypothetical protein